VEIIVPFEEYKDCPQENLFLMLIDKIIEHDIENDCHNGETSMNGWDIILRRVK